ncbi:SUF system Fe-S cluster assembly protein [Altererythrobacter aquiaggeris]|uniref:SUF system Fe-S cluster assembly protein n=1 Tax=Aestuarierythrobacter aquiaggeris TaxID=1898396 RepID=UPI00301A2D5E
MNDQSKIAVEEVDKVATPPRARVEDETPAESMAESMGAKLERKRDYLEGFLAKKPETTPMGEAGSELQQAVIDALKEIYDPEIPVNIYDLGLIYGVEVSADADVTVNMTLTTPNCPVAESMPGEVELRAGAVPGVRDAEVVLVWDPPWDPAKMSDEARLELGML